MTEYRSRTNLPITDLVKLIQCNFEQISEWVIHIEQKFGYISIAQYIRIIEVLNLSREEKDKLLSLALDKMDYANYESYFEYSHDLGDLHQKVFILIMLEYVSDYLKKKNWIVWEVIAKYYIEEHLRLCPWDINLDDFGSENTPKRRIYNFFLKKNIDIQTKVNIYTQTPTLFEMIIHYFHKRSSEG
jgi:hypothetical protein